MATRIHRVTLFKVPDPENQKKLLEAYKTLSETQQKDGKSYILYMAAGQAPETPRSNGYTVMAKTEFASLEDMKYYDAECPAHAQLKKTAGTLGVQELPTTVFFEGAPTINMS